MLAMSDRNGDIFASVPGLANRAGISIEEAEASILCFLSPDKYSRTKDYDGRRIAEIDGGWTLLNHGKYRALLSAEERKEYNRRKQQERRERLRKDPSVSMTCQTLSANVSKVSHTEAEAEADKEDIASFAMRHQNKPIGKKSNESTNNSHIAEQAEIIWKNVNPKSRERSSKSKLEKALLAIRKEELPTVEILKKAIQAWNSSQKWKDGYAEGCHIWVNDRQWENLPESADFTEQQKPKFRSLNS